MNQSQCRRLASAGLLLAFVCGEAAGASFTTVDAAQGGFLSSLSRDGRIAAGSYVGGGTYAGSWVWRLNVGGYDTPLNAVSGMNSWGQPIAGAADDGSGYQVAALGYSDVNTNGPVLIGPYPGALPLDNFYSQAYGVSDDGVVVGLATDAVFNAFAFRWTQAGGMTRLPVNRPDTYSRANGISGDGAVVYGWNDREDGYRSGVIWIDGSPIDVHNYGMYGDSFGSPPGEALSSNYDGSVVVGYGYWDDLLQSEAWRWTLATDTQPLGLVLPGGAGQFASLLGQYKFSAGSLQNAQLPQQPDDWSDTPQSFAAAVSEDGNTVVGSTGTPLSQDAFIWTPATGMVLLAPYAREHGVTTIPTGFVLYGAVAISADGKTIGGTGIDPTGTYVVPWVIDLHDAAPQDAIVTAIGSISSNDLTSGPFAGFPVGAAVTMTFHVASAGTPVTPGHASDYSVRVASFQLSATYLDTNDYSHPVATDVLDPNASPLLHLGNDNPRADSVDLDTAPTAGGQTLQFGVSNADGVLFDSDQVARINRSLSADLFNTAVWSVNDAGHSMNISLQWLTIQDDSDGIFRDGFDGN